MREYSCFVCAECFSDYELFKSHVIKEHEEGRHYVLCPLSRCQAPVRDLRAHFRARHPHDKMPQAEAMRAIEWRDLKGKKVKRVPIFKEGFFTSKKNNNDKRHYRSNLERSVYQLLEKRKDVEAYFVEPVGIDYTLEGAHRQYWPDLKIKFTDGRTEIWEIKPANQTGWAINEAKWDAAEHYCKLRDWQFKVITEKDVKNLRG